MLRPRGAGRFDRETDDGWNSTLCGRRCNADSFLSVGERQCADEVRTRVSKVANLWLVVFGRLVGRHGAPGYVPVAARANAASEHMIVPVALLGIAFMALIGYPAFARILFG